MKTRSLVTICSGLALLAVSSGTHASEILGIGTGALLGGDLTDPEDDGSPDANTNYDAVFASSSKQNFGPPEGAFNVFDNRIGGGNDKWCCGNDPSSAQWVQATFDQPVILSHFTIASGNDTPGRDPVDWEVQGSNDGVNFTKIFAHTGSNLWTARNQVIRWDGGGVDFTTPSPYTTIRLATTATGLGGGAFFQVNEFEIFGLSDLTDADNDGMLDSWEEDNGLDPADPGDADANNDADQLTNLEEFGLGTDPNDADTDDDGLQDHVEDNGGTWVSESETGTNPLLPDTDGDGLLDGAEDNGGVFVDANNTGTDPNNADSDSDGFDDGREVEDASNPNDPADKPPFTSVISLGTGTAALIGGDLTDPENDGVEGNNPGAGNWDSLNWNWVHVTASSEEYFGNFGGSEGAFDVFDNLVGAGQSKWCCNGPPQNITVEFASPVSLESFTVTSGNDTPDRDPLTWGIYGSNDGVSFTPIFEQDDNVSLWTQRLEVLLFTLPKVAQPYRFLRYEVTRTVVNHQINEIEYFGATRKSRLALDVEHSPDVPGALRLTWPSDPSQQYDVLVSADLSSPIESWAELEGSQNIAADPSGTNTLDIERPFPGLGFLAIRAKDPPPLFSEDFENGDGGWTNVTNDPAGNTEWQFGTPNGSGPTSGADGSANAWSTNLGDYGPDSDISLRSPAIDLTTVGEAVLSFDAYRDGDGFGETATVRFLRASDQVVLGADAPIDMTIFDADYEKVEIPVPVEAIGESILIEINFRSDASPDPYSGLSIDNVSLSAN